MAPQTGAHATLRAHLCPSFVGERSRDSYEQGIQMRVPRIHRPLCCRHVPRPSPSAFVQPSTSSVTPGDSLKARVGRGDATMERKYNDVYRTKTKRQEGGHTHSGLKPLFIFFVFRSKWQFHPQAESLSWVEKPRKKLLADRRVVELRVRGRKM